MTIRAKRQVSAGDFLSGNIIEFPSREVGSSADYSDITGDADGDILSEVIVEESARLISEAVRIKEKPKHGRPKKDKVSTPAPKSFEFYVEKIKAIPNDLTKAEKAKGKTLRPGVLHGWRAAQQAARETVNRDKRQTRTSIALHCELLDDINRSTGYWNHSVSFYAQRLGVNIRTAERAFTRLVETGVAVREDRFTKAGDRGNSRTTLVSLVTAAFDESELSAGTGTDAGGYRQGGRQVPADAPGEVPAEAPGGVPAVMPGNTSPPQKPLHRDSHLEPFQVGEGSPVSSPARPKAASQKKAKGMPLADDWELPAEWLQEAIDTLEITRVQLAAEARNFRDWHLEKGTVSHDWQATWRLWLSRGNYAEKKQPPWWTDPEQVKVRCRDLDRWREQIAAIPLDARWPWQELGPAPDDHGCILPFDLIRELRLTARWDRHGYVRRDFQEKVKRQEASIDA